MAVTRQKCEQLNEHPITNDAENKQASVTAQGKFHTCKNKVILH